MNTIGLVILVSIFVILCVVGLILVLAVAATRGRQRTETVTSLTQVVHNLPRWPIREALLQVSQELTLLQTSADIARKAGVPASLTERVIRESESAADSLRQSAERVAAAAAQRVDYAALAPYLQREEARLTGLAEAIRQTREGLAGLTLALGEEGALENAETRLRILGEVAGLPLPTQESVAAVPLVVEAVQVEGGAEPVALPPPQLSTGVEPAGGAIPAVSVTRKRRPFLPISPQNAERLTCLHSFTSVSGPASFCFSPDGSSLLALSSVDGAQLWRVKDGKLVSQVEHPGVRCVAMALTGGRLATGAGDGSVRLWRAGDSELLHTLLGHQGAVDQVAFSDNGSRLATKAGDGTVRLWRVHDGMFLYDLVGAAPDQVVISFFPLAVLGLIAGQTLQLWKAEDGLQPWVQLRNQDRSWVSSLRQVGLAPDATLVAVVEYCEYIEYAEDLTGHGISNIYRLRTWDVDGEPREVSFSDRLACEPARAGVLFAPDSKNLAWSVGENLSLLRMGPEWVRQGAAISRLRGHTAAVNSVSFAPDSTLVVSGADDATVRLWRTGDGALLRTLEGHSQPVCQVAFSADGCLLASASLDGNVQCWGVPV